MNKPFPSLSGKRDGERYGQVFFLGFLCLFLVLVPLMAMDGGYFIYYGDFISQQLPFYEHANEVVRSGGLLGWDWGTDLGSSFVGSYAFYLSGSPFFWMTALLPQKWALFAIPWLLCLKHGIAATTAYGYIRRFVQSKDAAVIGGLLYAFSGFQVFNIFFNHFQDVTAFFPLLLIAMEELVNNNRRGWFAACVALMAVINYFFFTGQVVFCIMYFLIRVNCRDFRIDLKKMAALAMEAVIGVCIACVVLLPAALGVIANSRVSQGLFGQNILFYTDKTRILRIIQSFFMIPDAPARPNLLRTNKAQWASIGGYLPLFSMAGVITFMREKKKHWATLLTWLCILFAFVPVLNSSFYVFNGSYYARWYYMPILIMAMMTAYALDNRALRWKPGVIACLVMLLVFGSMAFFPTKGENDTTEFFKFAANYPYFYVVLAMCLLCWLGLYFVSVWRREGTGYLRTAIALTAAACIVCTGTVVYFGKAISVSTKEYRESAINGRENLTVSYETDEADYFRVDISEHYDNYPMFWGLSSMRCFQSVVNPSIMDFYESIEVTRDVASRPDTSHYTLWGLFSVKYYFDKLSDDMPERDFPGFSLRNEENGFRIYQNDYYIPMGFTYDYYVTEEALANVTGSTRERLLIRALVLDEEQVQRYDDILTDASVMPLSLSKNDYLAACEKHRAEACENFNYDSKGFSADIALETPKLVFFSVPHESGWTATVNGTPVEVERVSNGFMAVRCEAGENRIEFRYELPGLRYGGLMTLAGCLLLGLYLAFSKPLFGKMQGRRTHSYDYMPTSGVRAARAYTQHLERRSEKGANDNGTPQ